MNRVVRRALEIARQLRAMGVDVRGDGPIRVALLEAGLVKIEPADTPFLRYFGKSEEDEAARVSPPSS